MDNITYDYYRIFYYVGKYGSFTKAAQMLKNSQPNITRAMNNLEAQLGVTLFSRNKRGVVLSPIGEKLFARMSVVNEQIRLAEAEIEASKIKETEIISVGGSDIAMYEVLYPILPEFRNMYPDISIYVSNESTNSAIKNLKSKTIDFAIVTTPIPEDSSFDKVELMEIKECAVVSKAYKKNINSSLSLKDLVDYPLIMLANGTATRTFYEDLFAKNGIELKPQMTASNINQAILMARAGLGIGFVPETIIGLDDCFKKLDCSEDIPKRSICIVTERNMPLGKSAQILVDYIKYKYIDNEER